MNTSLPTMNPNRRFTSAPTRLQRASGPGLPDIALAEAGEGGSFLHHPCLLLSAYSAYSAVPLSLTASLRPPSLANRAFSPFFKAVQTISKQTFSALKNHYALFTFHPSLPMAVHKAESNHALLLRFVSCEVFCLPKSKIENRKSKILLPPPSPAASLPPPLQSFLALWSSVHLHCAFDPTPTFLALKQARCHGLSAIGQPLAYHI
jgi:hypothetical protein